MKQALIVFTDLPNSGNALSGLRPYYTKAQCAGLHEAFLKDIYAVISDSLADIFVAYAPGEEADIQALKDIYEKAEFFEQQGDTFEASLYNSMTEVFNRGYSRVILIESTMPEFDGWEINKAFDILTRNDYVFGPLEDGSYWLVGARIEHDDKAVRSLFAVDFASDTVLEDTIELIPKWKKYELLEEKCEVVTVDDLLIFRENGAKAHAEEFLSQNHILSVVIPVYNEEKCLPKLFEELSKFAGRAELVFVDGESTDSSAALIGDFLAGRPDGKLIYSTKGRGLQLNAGAESANGDVMLFLHADTGLPDAPLDKILKLIKSSDAGYFNVEYMSGGLAMWYNKILIRRGAANGRIIGEQGMFMKRDVFYNNGMFKDIPFMEDIDFSMRLKDANVSMKPAGNIYPSTRRYQGGFFAKLKAVKHMEAMRQAYLAGADVEELLKDYEMIR